MDIKIDTAFGGAGLALFTYLLAFVIALVVAGLIQISYKVMLRKNNNKAVEEKK